MGADVIKQLSKELGGSGILKLTTDLGTDAVKQLSKELGAKGIKELYETFGSQGIKELINEIGIGGIKQIGVKGLKEIGTHLSPKEIGEWLAELGPDKMKHVAETYGGDAMKHYGQEFFKLHQGVTQDTMGHLLKNDGIVKGEIKGCHDQATFFSELSGKGEIVGQTPMPGNPDVVKYQYNLYKKDKAGKIIDPHVLSSGKPKLKTTMKDLASNPNKWQDIGNAAIDDAIKKKTLPQAGGEFVGSGQGTSIRGYYRDGKITSFFPNF